MQFKEEYTYDAPIDTVWKMFSDPGYASLRASKLQMTDPEVSADDSPDSIVSTTTGGVPTEMLPAAAKRFISPSTKAVFSEKWQRVGTDKIVGTIEVKAGGVPASLKADAELVGNGDKTNVVLNGEVKVSIPIIGKSVEREAVKFAPEIVKGELETSKEYLAGK